MSANLTLGLQAALAGELELMRNELRELVEPLSEEEFWRKPTDPGNSAGHLVLHLAGNLNHFAGAQLGGTGYIRDREREFADPNPPSKGEALARLDDAVAMFRRVVEGLSAEQFLAPHPATRFGSVVIAMVHLVAHFALHRGQISYITRLVRK